MERTVGAYLIEQELGRGGMGVVYRAKHRPTGVARALKLFVGPSDSELVARFRREAEALARVASEAVVPVHEAGVEQGRLFIAMGFMPGGSLRDRLKAKGCLEPGEALALAAALARVLESCHRAGIVHRDLKPENVLFDEEGRARLADFGLALDLQASRLTESGAALGTPIYMAPEQIVGLRADARADVYAVAVVLHELLTGRPPFTGNSTLDIHAAKVSGKRPPLPAGTPPGVDALLDRALAPDPEARYASARDMEHDLAALQAGKRLAWGPRTARRSPALLASAALGAIVLAAAIVTLRARSKDNDDAPPAPVTVEPVRPTAWVKTAQAGLPVPPIDMAPVLSQARERLQVPDYVGAETKLRDALAKDHGPIPQDQARDLVKLAIAGLDVAAGHDVRRGGQLAIITSRIATLLVQPLDPDLTMALDVDAASKELHGRVLIDAALLAFELCPERYAPVLARRAEEVLNGGQVEPADPSFTAKEARWYVDLAYSARSEADSDAEASLERSRTYVLWTGGWTAEALSAALESVTKRPSFVKHFQMLLGTLGNHCEHGLSDPGLEPAVETIVALAPELVEARYFRGRALLTLKPAQAAQDLEFVLAHARLDSQVQIRALAASFLEEARARLPKTAPR
jgi:serine/threonine-protein kinase